jgi:hypothetical protein
MADLGIIESEIQGLSEDKDKPIWKRIFREVVKTIAMGPVDVNAGSRAAINLRGHLYGPITTPAIANTEFSVAHRFGATPYLVIPVLPNETDAQLVRLTWTRAWDAKRIYLSSPDTDAMIFLYLEG